jgi:hypothetical protein
LQNTFYVSGLLRYHIGNVADADVIVAEVDEMLAERIVSVAKRLIKVSMEVHAKESGHEHWDLRQVTLQPA